jgi:P-type Ca2+ transporter type 2C
LPGWFTAARGRARARSLQGLLDTTSLDGRQWLVVLALSLLAPAVAIDKFIQLSRQRKAQTMPTAEIMASAQVGAEPGLLG